MVGQQGFWIIKGRGLKSCDSIHFSECSAEGVRIRVATTGILSLFLCTCNVITLLLRLSVDLLLPC